MTAMSAFITARKGFCYLTVRHGRRNFDMMRLRNYVLDAEDKRQMRRLYPDVIFDWRKIVLQLAEKREACRRFRSRRRSPDASRASLARESFHGVFDPGTRTVYVDRVPSSVAGAGALIDAIVHMDRTLRDVPSRRPASLEPREQEELAVSRQQTGIVRNPEPDIPMIADAAGQ
jgi:hypothetical protein